MQTDAIQKHRFNNLYARNKRGQVIIYKARVEDYHTHSAIITETGLFNGKLIQKRTPVKKGKNIGKANETTHWHQAFNEAESKWLEKKTEGYKSIADLEKIHNVAWDRSPDTKANFVDTHLPEFNTDHNNRVKPMLAEKWGKHKHKVKYPVLAQPKYNGVRCRIINENGTIVLVSREGIEYNVDHIIRDASFLVTYSEDFILDGELYLHGTALQDLVSLVKTPQLGTEEVKFMTYDLCNKDIQSDRLVLMRSCVKELGKSIVASEDRVCKDEEDVMNYFRECRNKGYEGIIVRDLNKPYYFGFRDTALLKVKETMSAEFEIVGYHLKSEHPAEDFVWKCAIANGNTFEVKPHGTIEERVELYNNADDYIGKYLQLDFFEYTNDNIPFHITSVTVRDYE